MQNYLIPNWDAPKNICAYTTLRTGGVSQPPYDSFNLSTNVGDDLKAVTANRTKLKQDLQLPNEPYWLNQIHSDKVVAAKTQSDYSPADASYTTQANIVCAVLTADCLPILLCSKQGNLVAAIHAGWKGILNGIIEATIKTLPILPADLIVWFGPAIGPQAFEVGNDVREQFISADAKAQAAFAAITANKWLGNIYLLGKQRLNNCGITSIYGGEFCTYSDPKNFFSFRRSAKTGRMASLLFLG